VDGRQNQLRAVVATGLGFMGIFFLWVSTLSAATPFWLETVGQMVVIAHGLELTTAPATEAIMGVVHKDKAGVGSPSTTPRASWPEPSVWLSSAASPLRPTPRSLGEGASAGLPAEAAHAARESVGGALLVLQRRLLSASSGMFTQPSSSVAVAGSSLAATLMLEPRDGDGGTPLHPWEHHLEELPDLRH
jgi:hypothetical protein